jgi:hypothetical protein
MGGAGEGGLDFTPTRNYVILHVLNGIGHSRRNERKVLVISQ